MKFLPFLRFLRIVAVWVVFAAFSPVLAAPQAQAERSASPSEAEARLTTELAAKEELFLSIRESAASLKPYFFSSWFWRVRPRVSGN